MPRRLGRIIGTSYSEPYDQQPETYYRSIDQQNCPGKRMWQYF